jgi:hypothetical protein
MKARSVLFLGFLSLSSLASFEANAFADEPAAPPEPTPPPSTSAAPNSWPPLPSAPATTEAPSPPSLPAPAVAPAQPPQPTAVVRMPPRRSAESVVLRPAPSESADVASFDGVDRRVEMWRLEVGYRGSYVPAAGFDPFSTNNALPQFSLAASRTLFALGRLSLALGVSWDVGGSSATARGDQASLGIQRLEVPIELRAHLGRLGYLFVRGAPGAVSEHASVQDDSSAATLSKTTWSFATDLSAGFAFLIFPQAREVPRTVHFWLQADGGYGWVASQRLNLGPDLASSDGRIASGIDLGTLDLSGGFFRVALAASY